MGKGDADCVHGQAAKADCECPLYHKKGCAGEKSIEENAAIAQTVMDKIKNLEALKLDIINSVSEFSAISEENAASNEEVTARVTEIAESVNRISEDTQTVRKVSSDMKELMDYFK